MTNEDVVKGKWKQLRGKVRQQWGDLTDDDIDKLDGSQTQLEGLIQERYGIAREKARDEVRSWADRI